MKPFLSAVALAGAALTLAAVTGCSADTTHAEPSAASPHVTQDADTAPSGCPTRSSLSLPKDFPADLPVPGGAVVTSVEHRTGNRLVVSTVVRNGFDATLTFLQKQLPKAGYTLKEGEVEKDDAESNFSSPTIEGRWALREMPHCEGGVYLTYLTSAAS